MKPSPRNACFKLSEQDVPSNNHGANHNELDSERSTIMDEDEFLVRVISNIEATINAIKTQQGYANSHEFDSGFTGPSSSGLFGKPLALKSDELKLNPLIASSAQGNHRNRNNGDKNLRALVLKHEKSEPDHHRSNPGSKVDNPESNINWKQN